MKPTIVVAFAGIGLLMGVAAVAGLLHPRQETLVWIVVALGGALWISGATTRPFLTGFLSGLVAGMLPIILEALFLPTYFAHNPDAAKAFASLPKGFDPRVMCLAISPFYGGLTGLILGFLAWLAGKLRPKPKADATPIGPS